MREKVCNEIALRQMSINELKELKSRIIKNHCGDDVKFIIQTKEFNPFDLATFKCKNKLDVSVYTITKVIDEIITKEKERIDKLIDMEIENRIKK